MGEVSWLEDGAIETIGAKPLVEVGGPHGVLHFQHAEHALGHSRGRLQPGPHDDVCIRVDLVPVSSVHFLKVVRDGLIDLVLLADKLVLHDDGFHHWVA